MNKTEAPFRLGQPGRVRTAYHFDAQTLHENKTFRRNLTLDQHFRKIDIRACSALVKVRGAYYEAGSW